MTTEYPNGECPACGSNGRDHAIGCREDTAARTIATLKPRQDTRKTSPEKLEATRELANDMAREAAREPKNDAMQKLARYSERLHRILDGEW